MSEKIFPRNLTARAAYMVPGNPVVTRMEDSVGNCYPGLEFDHRNLDRRFFPGLVFEFVDQSDDENAPKTIRQGIRLIEVNLSDSALSTDTDLAKKLNEKLNQLAGNLLTATALSSDYWFIKSIKQGGKEIDLFTTDTTTKAEVPMNGLTAWRFVRCLEGGMENPIELTIQNRSKDQLVVLDGWRRAFVDPDNGVIGSDYIPGELTQSLCSPWMHDFRDCGCHYWASNRPDVVFGEIIPGQKILPDGSPADPTKANTRINWMRADRNPDRDTAALDTRDANRTDELDHYQINHKWQDLSFVLEEHEISGAYFPRRQTDGAIPFSSPSELFNEVQAAASVEITVVVEYLYSLYAMKSPDEVDDETLKSDLAFVRHNLNLLAISEMTHMRLSNQILWELKQAKLADSYEPVLTIPQTIQIKVKGEEKKVPVALNPLTNEVLNTYIALEEPSGDVDGLYSRIVATLRQDIYPPHLNELAVRIATEGMDHFSKFLDIKKVLKKYKSAGTNYPYLRNIQVGTVAETATALGYYKTILLETREAYLCLSNSNFDGANHHISRARSAMQSLNGEAEALAKKGIGVPFLDKSNYPGT